MSIRTRVPGRGWAYVGVILGGLVSIAANVAHTFIPPVVMPVGWRPEPMAIGFAVCWPVFLFVAVEILARTPWPRRGGYALTRWVGLLPVALVAAFVSYRHLSGLLAHYGEEPLVTVFGPLAVDGLMVMATAAIMATNPRHNPSVATSPTVATNQQSTVVPVPADVPAELLTGARIVADAYRQATGTTIPVDELADRMRTTIPIAERLLTALGGTGTHVVPARVNGTPVVIGAAR